MFEIYLNLLRQEWTAIQEYLGLAKPKIYQNPKTLSSVRTAHETRCFRPLFRRKLFRTYHAEPAAKTSGYAPKSTFVIIAPELTPN
jgi:hypothetical protein